MKRVSVVWGVDTGPGIICQTVGNFSDVSIGCLEVLMRQLHVHVVLLLIPHGHINVYGQHC